MKFSIIIPVHNEADSLQELHKEILAVMSVLGETEIIYSNDGSTDSSLDVIKQLSNAICVSSDERRGQTAAIALGFARATGEYVISIDGDGQNDPKDIPALYAHLQKNNADCVSGWRKNRRDPTLRRMLAQCARVLRFVIAADPTKDSGCTLKIYKKSCLQGLELKRGMHRFIPLLLKKRGYSVEEIEVNHRPRLYGKSKYGLSRLLQGFSDLVTIAFKYGR